MHCQSPHPDMTPGVRNVWSLANRQNQQKPCPSGNSQYLPAMWRVSVMVGERDSSQGERSETSTIQGQNSTTSSSLNNARIADFNQRVTSTPSSTQRRPIHTPTATPSISSRSTPAPGRISTRHVVSRPASSVRNGPSFGPGGYYRSAWQRPYPIKIDDFSSESSL